MASCEKNGKVADINDPTFQVYVCPTVPPELSQIALFTIQMTSVDQSQFQTQQAYYNPSTMPSQVQFGASIPLGTTPQTYATSYNIHFNNNNTVSVSTLFPVKKGESLAASIGNFPNTRNSGTLTTSVSKVDLDLIY